MGFMGKSCHTRSAGFRDALRILTMHGPMSGRSSGARVLLLSALGASACASNPVGMQGQWVGTVKPVSGTCDPASQAVLTIRSGSAPPYAVIFAPTSGVLTLHGNSDGDSQVEANLHTVGMNHQPYVLAFRGTRSGDLITGTYITQRCRSDVELRRE